MFGLRSNRSFDALVVVHLRRRRMVDLVRSPETGYEGSFIEGSEGELFAMVFPLLFVFKVLEGVFCGDIQLLILDVVDFRYYGLECGMWPLVLLRTIQELNIAVWLWDDGEGAWLLINIFCM